MDFDPYVVLGVPSTATAQEIRRAYLQQVREHHPDAKPAIGQSTPSADEALRRVVEAYELLRDPERRARYDRAHARAESASASLRIPVVGLSFRVRWLSD
ncbi:J domain-containing protein [Mycobacterium sp. ACS1612]|uniref:J domain-containing protein n=1 Tax=Mycobacterium sp. ACS1612 TaxID=1834117 RepID=UPI0009EDEE6A